MRQLLTRISSSLAALLLVVSLTGCYVTKAVSVPMRIVGAVVSAVPVVGNLAHDTIDEAAEVVDSIP